MKDDRLYLEHILECIRHVTEFTRQGREAFLSDRKTQDAVLRNLQTLGESTRRLSDTIKNRHPEVDWRAVAAFRNVLVHDYLGLDLYEVWEIVEHDLPDLKPKVEAILRELGNP
ncbi:MAG TPA: DUF86 domain-containing protein [Terriglobia bacterium]|nr:DUF86 domain-containing protein [Terriglobia bacterium]